MKSRFLLLLTVFVFSLCPVRAQLTGRVLDGSTRQPMPFASVAVWQKNARDSTLLGGTSTDTTGRFVISNLPASTVRINISFVGYQAIHQLVMLSGTPGRADLGTIMLLTDAQQLREVKITGEKADLTMNAEKRVFNVGKNLTSLGGTAESLLRNVPSINMDEGGNPSLRGMATTIYVNGKPSQLTLAQIPANQIESVEVITNPSARYDASTSGGIVNLILKKNREPGYNGTVSAGIGNNHRYDATANIDWHEGRWNVTALYSLNATKNPLTGYVHRINQQAGTSTPTGYFDQNTLINLNNRFQNGRLVVDYAAGRRNVFSLAGTLAGGAFNTISAQQYTYRNAAGALTGSGSRTLDPQNNFTNTGGEFDWKHSFSRKGQELSLMTSVTRNQVSNAANWLTTAYNADGTTQPAYPERDRIDGRIIGHQYLFQLDYVQPVSDSAKWEFGIRSFTYNRDTEYLFNQLSEGSGAYVLLPTYSQNADIRETVNAAYALYTRTLRNGINLQAGLRLEQSSLHGLSRFDGTRFGYDYPSRTGQNLFQSLFPSFSATRKLSGTSDVGLSLSRKVGRPNFRHVFVGIQANDRQNITIGNPAVRPEFVNTAELTYTHTKGPLQWLATAYYIYEDHTIKPFTRPLATDPTILVTTFINVKADIQYGLDQTLRADPGRRLTLTGNVNVRNFTIQSETLRNQLWVYNAKLNLTYRFPANISAQAGVFRDSRGVSLQGYRQAVNSMDFAIRKSFMQNRASVVFTINDVFNSRRFITTYEQPTVFQSSMNRREVRFYKVTLQLPLGRPGTAARRSSRKLDRPDVDFSN
nr:TonB-dependent receptor [uncultured Arsenicibacter sp.]